MIKTASRERWEKRNRFTPNVSEAMIDTGHILVEKMQESEVHPAVALHGTLYGLMVVAASCKISRDQIREIINDNADDLLALAVENVQFSAPVGQDVSEITDGVNVRPS